jgi:4-hydroxybenzoate polyprenyltransferase
MNGQGIIFYAGLGVAGWLLFRQLFKTNIDAPKDCLRFFLLSAMIGKIISCALVVDVIVHRFVNGNSL